MAKPSRRERPIDMKATMLTILIALLVVGCSSSFRVIETTDSFEPDSRRLTSSPIKIKSPRRGEEDLSLRLGFYESVKIPDGLFTMTITRYGDLWVLPDEIKILVNGNVTSLRPRLPSVQEVEIGRVAEHMTVEVPEKLLRAMISAPRVEFRVLAPASDLRIDRVMRPENQDLLREFYLEVRSGGG